MTNNKITIAFDNFNPQITLVGFDTDLIEIDKLRFQTCLKFAQAAYLGDIERLEVSFPKREFGMSISFDVTVILSGRKKEKYRYLELSTRCIESFELSKGRDDTKTCEINPDLC